MYDTRFTHIIIAFLFFPVTDFLKSAKTIKYAIVPKYPTFAIFGHLTANKNRLFDPKIDFKATESDIIRMVREKTELSKNTPIAVCKRMDSVPSCPANTGGMSLEWAKAVLRGCSEKDYAEAYSVISEAAEDGSGDGRFCLGLMYARGQGVDRDLAVAADWFFRAAESGSRSAMYYLGKMYFRGFGVEKNIEKSIELFTVPAEEGDPRAQYSLGLIYFEGESMPRDFEKAAEWITKAAEQGHSDAQFALGQFYKTGCGVEADTDRAVDWLVSAAMNGSKGAGILLGNMYSSGDGVSVDKDESDRWYDMADGR